MMSGPDNLPRKPLFWLSLSALAALFAFSFLSVITFAPRVPFSGSAAVFAVLFVASFTMLLPLSLIVSAFAKQHWARVLTPVLLTVFVIVWTLAVQPFTQYDDYWALWPVTLALPLAFAVHIYLAATLRPKWPLVGYAAVHLSALLLIVVICLMRISKDSL
jgi:hypothetical protein